MSVYDSLGETVFSITDPTISAAPPFKYTRSIAYNGSYWMAAGTIVLRSVGIKSFSAVKDYENQADYYAGQIKLDSLNGTLTTTQRDSRKAQWLAEKQKNLDLAKTFFADYSSKNFIPQSFTRKTLHCLAKSEDGYNWKFVEECPIFTRTFTTATHVVPSVAIPL